MNIKKNLFRVGSLTTALTLTIGLFTNLNKNALSVGAYDISDLVRNEIDLNDCTEQEIRDYYSDLNSLDISERQGTNLLKNLKPILKNNQKYYSYDSNTKIWQMYEITDRDWEKSPADSTVYGTYDPTTNKIYNYQYGTSDSDKKNNPYIHALYVNRDIDNQTTAWDDHEQDAWGINQEHIWAKSHGFDVKGAGQSGGARGDPMHLWAGNGWANNVHSNNFFAFVDKTRDYTDCGDKYQSIPENLSGYSRTLGGNEKVFEPQDCDKGDIARAIFYMAARYNYYSGEDEDPIDGNNPNLVLLNDLSENDRTGTSASDNPFGMGLLSDLLAWNKLDPVDEYEVHRNNLLYKNYTNNRNPFIDFPNWADAIWGTSDSDGTNYDPHVVGRAYPATDPIGSVTGPFEISSRTMEIIKGDTEEIYGINAEDVITWSVEDDEVVSLNMTTSLNKEKVSITALEVGTTTITATCNGVQDSCVVTVREPTPTEAIERKDTSTMLSYRYSKEEGRVPTTDTLDRSFTGAENSATYTDWINDGQSGVEYAGNCAGRYGSVQLQSGGGSGIVNTGNNYGTNALTVTVTWESNTPDGRIIDIYGKNSAYESPADLYANATRGTKIGSIVKGTSTSLTIDEDYKYIGIRSYSNTIYVTSIEIEWSATQPKYTYSDVSIRFTGLLSQDLWNELDTNNHVIQGFGVMIATDDVIDENAKIKDSYESAIPDENDPDVTDHIVDYFMSSEEMATPVVKGNDYYWNLFFRISTENFNTTYVAAAYIKVGNDYVFFKQVRYSVKSLAEDYIDNRGYSSTVASGSLANLANI